MALEDPKLADLSAQLRADPPPFTAAIISPDDGSANPMLGAAGLTLVERQRRQLQRLGVNRIAFFAKDEAASAPVGGAILLIEAGLVVDDRLLSAFVTAARARSATAGPLIARESAGQAGGLAWLPRVVAGQALPDWSRLAARSDCFDLSEIDNYAPDRRRRVPLLWERPPDAAAATKVGQQLLAAAQKGCLDWPARFIHPPVENLAVRLLWPTPVSPNAISLLAFGLGLYAAWCFAGGALWAGLLLALLIGPLDGIDGKLARTRVEFSRWGDLEHVGDKIIEFAWFAALAAHFSTGWAWALAALIVSFALSEALQGEFYRRITGAQLDDAGAFERGWRLVSGRRNTFFWSLLPFAWFEQWEAGFVTIAVYAAVTWFVAQWRFFVRLFEYGRANSTAIAANLDATAYGFMPTGAPEAEPQPEPVRRAAA